jgi:hypothetical protein
VSAAAVLPAARREALRWYGMRWSGCVLQAAPQGMSRHDAGMLHDTTFTAASDDSKSCQYLIILVCGGCRLQRDPNDREEDSRQDGPERWAAAAAADRRTPPVFHVSA